MPFQGTFGQPGLHRLSDGCQGAARDQRPSTRSRIVPLAPLITLSLSRGDRRLRRITCDFLNAVEEFQNSTNRPRIVVFLLAWFGLNLLFGISSVGPPGEQSIAWEAHIGEFFAGLLLFPLFDPVRAQPT
jgi:membrane associated rhomboid family serine protease